MDTRLQQAAESGSIYELYALIDENPNILESMDAVSFVSTPLHVAAASGNVPFAKEILNLKPSFARKLNTIGYSPLHLAVNKDRDEYVKRMLLLDGSLACVKGRNGITPFLLLVSRGNIGLVTQCLIISHKCIKDTSVDDQNALHLAVINDKTEVLQVLIGWIQRMGQRDADSVEDRVLNEVDLNYNTPLHLAAYKNDHEMVKLLLECRMVQRNKINGVGLTFLDILRNQEQRGLDLEQLAAKTECKEAASLPRSKAVFEILKSPFNFLTCCSILMRRLRTNISDESRGAYLIVCTLIITATYQTALQPPGGVHQSGDSNAGSVVMKHTLFFLLWIYNTLGFYSAILCTCCLIPLGSMFESLFFTIVTTLCISYALAMAVISPHPLVFVSTTLGIFLFVALSFLNAVFLNWRNHQTVASKPRMSWFWKD